MQSAPNTKHDLFTLLSDVNQPLPKQLKSFAGQLRNVCCQLQQVSTLLVLSVCLGAYAKAGGNRSLQHFNCNRVAVMLADRAMPGPLGTVTILHS